MGKLTVGLTRFLLVCAVGLALTLLVPAEVFAYGEKLAVSPLWGPAGRTVTVIGTEWHDYARLGWEVLISIGFNNVLGRAKPNANGEFSVNVTIPPNTPAGPLHIYGSEGKGNAIYTVSNTPPPGCVDAYFIGVHGVQQDAGSPEIEETWRAFAANVPPGKTALYNSLPYHAPDFKSWADPANLFGPSEAEGVRYLDLTIKPENNGILKILCPMQSIVLVGYSLGAWVVNDWLSKNPGLWPNIRAVVLYGAPLWRRSGQGYSYAGLAAGLLTPNPYGNNPPGPGIGISDRWQSWCIQNDPVCGEGWDALHRLNQMGVAIGCPQTNCEHLKYTRVDYGHGRGYDLTTGGGKFLASQAFP
jgi:Cutinase